ncbi:hypothetical protein COW81_02280 [Candidatus Campbellbacteria bacterium CG22_combo_CG10-13_8_21_14_all_36_13]|uniref:MurNAc-LAA domain-containing protein n=1 Tax=Candidatus Campbellbacteria bacterium CG22_combo_CG10-13_8_21_14_all_36_13 TaxID=1974529 RepID=A0A2H0DYW4_9BACT|nr:MAG: hypothetical protein COW81_02280 [Candidatus Campbellbacteria bacterium CG22_combo_CG10-13_8_21_14_all_36_13]
MNRKTVFIFISLILFSIFVLNIPSETNIKNAKKWLVASVSIFHQKVSANDLRKEYAYNNLYGTRPINILIVPGHDKDSWGTQFGSIKETDLNIELATYLYEFLRDNTNFNAMITQDKTGYLPVFSNYFINERESIVAFRDKHGKVMNSAIEQGWIESINGVEHNFAPNETAIKLYGINRWANENKIDIVIHIHFNDYPGRKHNVVGKYTGFSIYVPDSQYSNGKTSKEFGSFLLKRINTRLPISDLGKESVGVVEDQELIAIGSKNTLDAVSALIEYGYIYEPQFRNLKTRSLILKEAAYQTYKGIIDFFENKKEDSQTILADTTLLPYLWEKDLEYGTNNNDSTLFLQIALIKENLYPPKNKSVKICPVTGLFGFCTLESVKEFQKINNINPTGYVGPQTRSILNQKYSI